MTRAVVIASLVMAAGVASADPSEAERLYTEGQRAYDDKRYDDALVAWQRSYELSKLPGLVFNIAQAHRLKGECTKAVASYRMFVELDPTSTQRAQAENLVRELEPCKDAPPPVIQHTEPPVARRDAPPIAGTRHDDMHVRRGRGKLIGGAVLGVVGLGAIGAGVYFGNRVESLGSDVKAACAVGCAWADVKDRDAEAHRDVVLEWSLLAGGVAALAASGVLYYLGATERSTPSAMAIVPRSGGATFTWQRSW